MKICFENRCIVEVHLIEINEPYQFGPKYYEVRAVNLLDNSHYHLKGFEVELEAEAYFNMIMYQAADDRLILIEDE